MKLAKLVSQLVTDAKGDRSHPAATTHTGAVVPYLKFSDFQRSIVSSCTEATGVILFAANPADVIPHCVSHTALLGLSSQLLNDEVGLLNRPIVGSPASANMRSKFASSSSSASQLSLLVSNGAPNDRSAERSILDVSHLKNLQSSDPVLMVLANAARQGTWVLLPEVSALPLSIWTDIGKLFTGVNILTQIKEEDDENQQKLYRRMSSRKFSRGAAEEKSSSLEKTKSNNNNNNNEENNNNNNKTSSSLTGVQLAAVEFAREYGLDETNFSPHFRFVAFLTEKSAALGRTLPPKITSSIKVIDTRGIARTAQELSALFSAVVPLSEKQFSLLCVGIGDGRQVDVYQRSKFQADSLDASKSILDTSITSTITSSNTYSPSDLSADLALVNSSLGQMNTTSVSSTLASPNHNNSNISLLALRHEHQKQHRTPSSPNNNNNNSNTTTTTVNNAPSSFLVDWPCASALADAKNITLFSSESATTTEYVDSALFALRETLLRSLRDMISTAKLLDNRFNMTRRKALEARALRTGQDISELEQIETMRQAHAETHMSRLEKTPGWLYPEIYNWALSCAPMVNLEKLPMISHEDLTFDDIIWVHEGVGDATACLKGSWELSPVCLKCALPSVRGDVTRELNDKLIIEGRTLLSLRHPAILATYGVCELPSDLANVQGGNMVLRPLLSAATMHERWLDAQEDSMRNNNNNSSSGGTNNNQQNAEGGGNNNSHNQTGFVDPSTVIGSTSSAIVKQYALVIEPFEMSLEQLLVDSFDKSKRWTVEQFLDVGVSILRALVHLSEKYVHRCVCPGNIVVCSQSLISPSAMVANENAHREMASSSSKERKRKDEENDDDYTEEDEAKRGGNNNNQTPEKLASSSQSPPSFTGPKFHYQYKLTHFSACIPTNRRVAPSWLLETSTAKLPLRYQAPETFYGQFSASSDIWSFGVSMWSALHYCRKQPYEGGNDGHGGGGGVNNQVFSSGTLLSSADSSSVNASSLATPPMKGRQNTTHNNQFEVDNAEFVLSDHHPSTAVPKFGSPGDGDDLSAEEHSSSLLSMNNNNNNNNTANHQHQNSHQADAQHNHQYRHRSASILSEDNMVENNNNNLGYTPQSVAEGVSRGTLRLTPLPDHFPAFFWDQIIEPCLRRRPQERPDARALISTIMLLKVQNRGLMNQFVEFDRPGF